jgi:D-3-phosphoglycerate dehydrogenase / 2-oxoglutarate reductase
VRIINCARGGLVDEEALADLIKSGHVAGAAFDVFAVEPAESNPLFGLPNVICTPHLGASTSEAQENVALQVAEQMSDYLLSGAITNAVNFPSISAEEAPRVKPFVALAEKLGSFLGQLTESSVKAIRIIYEGKVSDLNTKPMTSAAIAGVLRPFLSDINMVNAAAIAKDKGITVDEVKRESPGTFESRIKIHVEAEDMTRHAAGTVLSDGVPRIVEIRDIKVDAAFAPHMIYIRNDDKPGFIGAFGSLLGDAGVNVATFNLGRDKPGGDAICYVAVDERVDDALLQKVEAIPQVKRARRLAF